MVVDTSEGLDSAVDRPLPASISGGILRGERPLGLFYVSFGYRVMYPNNGRVIEVAAGYCEFINNIRAQRKGGIDINPETIKHAPVGSPSIK